MNPTILTHWKSTVQSILTGVIGLAGLSSTPEFAWLPPKYAGALAGAAVIAKIVLGAIQKDPDVVLAKVPGTSEPQAVPAHAVPDDPTAKAIANQ